MSSLTGKFLVARAILNDPNFKQTVVLLLAHGDEGAYGVVVNRNVDVEGVPFAVHFGGPCEAAGVILLHGHSEWAAVEGEGESVSSKEVLPGVYLGDAECLKKAGDADTSDRLRVRVFRGYSGWGPGQLEGELASGAWTLCPADADLLFDAPVDDLWFKLAPSRIPDPSLN